MLDTEITFLQNVRRPGVFKAISLRKALLDVRNGIYKKPVEAAQLALILGDDDEYRRLKGELPCYALHGTFEGKVVNDNFVASSGLVHFDLDHLDDLEGTRTVLKAIPHTVFCFVSPSGGGIKGAFKVDPTLITDDASFKTAFMQMEASLAEHGLACDKACKDVRRVTYVSSDPKLYYNKKATVFPLNKLPDTKKMPEAVLDYIPIEIDGICPDINASNAAKYLPPAGEQSYSEWRDIGAILHYQFGGNDEGLEIYDTWSQSVREYKGYDDVAKQWSAFKRTNGKVLSFKTLIKQYHEREAKERGVVGNDSLKKAKRLVNECHDHLTLVDDVAPKLWRLADRNVSLEVEFRELLMTRYYDIHGSRLDKASATRAMKMHRKKEAVDPGILNGGGTPSWAKDWVWVGEDEKFTNISTRVSLSSFGFKSMFNDHLPQYEGAPIDIGAMVKDQNLIPKVMRSMYAPGYDRIFKNAEVAYVNTYSEVGRAIATGTRAAEVELFLGHIEKVCGGRNREFYLICNYLACCVGSPPTKVRWAPLLIGTFGDGKSLFHKFLALAIGLENTRTVSCSAIISAASTGFSGWAKGVCFILVDELKLQGHNRHDVINSLKTYQSDDMVPLMLKGKEAGQMLNSANFWFNSNFRDCVPVEEGNRRLMVLHSKLNLKTLEEAYFHKLHQAIDNAAGDIAEALLAMPVHADFDPNGHAPMTDAKNSMIRLSKDDLIEQIVDIMNEGHPHYQGGVVVFDSLYIRMSSGHEGLKLDSAYKLTAALTSMGFSKLGRESINNQRHCLWGQDVNGEIPSSKWAKNQIVQRSIGYKPVDDLI